MNSFLPPDISRDSSFSVTDMHAAGEPVRILEAGGLGLGRDSPLAKRRLMQEKFDHLRRYLMHEPRGHADMYGAILSEPQSDDADASVLFIHCSGYSTMCGHATIALGRYLYDRSRAGGREKTAFRLEAPCGLLDIEVLPDEAGRPCIRFDSVACFAEAIDETVKLDGVGEVRFDLCFGGAYYAIVPAAALGCDLATTPVERFSRYSASLVSALRAQRPITHPKETDLSFLYGAILTDGLDCSNARGRISYNLCWFGDGQLDRSPTGSGICARLAVDYAKGRAKIGDSLEVAGLSGEAFRGTITSASESDATIAVAGRAYYTGQTTFVAEESDPLCNGFQIPEQFAQVMSPHSTSR